MKRPGEKKDETVKKEVAFGKVDTFDVSNVRDTKAGVFFTLTLNGVCINDCKVGTTNAGKDFIGLPSRKGKDGNWYSTVYFKFTDEDSTQILTLVERLLNS